MVSTVALGCWPIAGMTSLEVNDADSLATIRAAIESGVNFIDTAHCYGMHGESEMLVGKAVSDFAREDLVIATKGGIHWDEDGVRHFDGSAKRILFECEESLRRMDIDVIDLYYLHAPDPDTPVEESAQAFRQLLDGGKVKTVGVSNLNVEQMERFAKVCPITCAQPPYNMLQRDIERDVVPWCVGQKVSIANYWPLMKGLLAGKIRRGHQFDPADKRLTYEVFQGEQFEAAQQLLDKLDEVADSHGATVAQVVVSWTISQAGIASTLCGAKRAWQIEETAKAMDLDLNEAEILAINALLS